MVLQRFVTLAAMVLSCVSGAPALAHCTEQQKLTASDAATDDNFGDSNAAAVFIAIGYYSQSSDTQQITSVGLLSANASASVGWGGR